MTSRTSREGELVSFAFKPPSGPLMHQNPFLSNLGSDLRAARLAAGFTQATLGARVGISLPTLRQAERGLGALATFTALANVLGKEISGRSLPPGKSLGARLMALRKRRGLGRRPLADLAGISATTLAMVEKDGDGHLTTVLRVGDALGARLELVEKGSAPGFWTATAASSVHEAWTTPPELLEALYNVVGGQFELDPCSPVRKGPRTPVRARLRYVAADDALTLPWKASTVFMNPPYGRQLRAWVAKARLEVADGRAGVVFALLPARCDTGWWHQHVAGITDVWMLRGRLAFGDGAQAAPFPSAIVVWSATDEHRARMTLAFPSAWHVPAQAAPSTEWSTERAGG